jgi:adenine-specific DNA-methyltransferase
LVVIDEAHRLRNVYKPSNVIANTLKRALEERHKLLLTASPDNACSSPTRQSQVI